MKFPTKNQAAAHSTVTGELKDEGLVPVLTCHHREETFYIQRLCSAVSLPESRSLNVTNREASFYGMQLICD